MITVNAVLRRPLLWLIVFIITSGVGTALRSTFPQDADNYIPYRFAANLRDGYGLVYRLAGEADVTTFPLVPGIIAGLANVGLAPPAGGLLVVGLSLALAGFLLARLSGNRWSVGVVYITVGLLYPAVTLQPMIALGVGAVWLAARKQWAFAGVLLGLALLTDPYAIPLALLLIVVAIAESWRSLWRLALPTSGLVGVGFGTLMLVYQPARIVYAAAFGLPLFTFFVGLGVVIVYCLKRPAIPPVETTLALWGVIAVVSGALSRQFPTMMLVLALVILLFNVPMAAALRWGMASFIVVGEVVFFLIFTPLFASPQNGMGAWLSTQLSRETLLATDQLGQTAYDAGTRILDLSGQIGALNRSSIALAFLSQYAPDAIASVGVAPEGLAGLYAPVNEFALGTSETLTVYFRVVNWSAIVDHPVEINFSESVGRSDLRLVGVGLGDPLHPGEYVRVRLDWETAYPATFQGEFALKLDLLDAAFSGYAPGVVTTIPAANWGKGRFSTWHVMVLPKDTPTGAAALWLNLTVRGGNLPPVKVAEVQIAP